MPRAEITIKVSAREDYVPVKSFLSVIGNTLSILRDLSHTAGLEDTGIPWKVSAASLKSPLTLTIFSDAPRSEALVREYVEIFEQSEKSEVLPFGRWEPRILERARELVSVLSDGISQITLLGTDMPPVTPTERVAATVNYLLAPAYEDHGSLEGSLETLSVHGRTHFNIFDPISKRATHCYFHPELLKSAHAAFNHRVIVTGKVKYNRIGEPVSIRVEGEGIRILEGGVKPSEFERTDITEGIESWKYVRGLRDA